MAVEAQLTLLDEGDALGISRRAFAAGLAITTFLAACSQPSNMQQAGAQTFAPPDPGFLALSKALTGHLDLDGIIAARTSQALRELFPNLATKIAPLTALAKQYDRPKDLLEAAIRSGAGEAALAIVAAWYTGTVGTGQTAQSIAYADALMNRPVSDALFPPTYQMGGPGWWTATPPPVAPSSPHTSSNPGLSTSRPSISRKPK
jgi:hypothetical protein